MPCGRCYDVGSLHAPNHAMRPTTHRHHLDAARVVAGIGMAGLDSGVVFGLVMAGADRPAGCMPHPATPAGIAGGRSQRLIAAH